MRAARGRGSSSASIGLLAAALLFAVAGRADASEPCRKPFSLSAALRTEASLDLYNAGLWFGGAAAVRFGADTNTRWSDSNGFDREIRDGLRIDSTAARERADTASDVLLGVSAGLLPLSAIALTWHRGDCEGAYDLATDAAESLALTLFVTEAMKVIAGRERPFVRDCDGSPPGDADCDDSDRRKSFFSGHASLAAAGAGLSCSYAIRERAYGDGAWARAAPCALGAGAAIATGILRMSADRHWGSDVLVGWVIGAAIGSFDTWGPFDLLRFDSAPDRPGEGVSGIVLPYAGAGQMGARVSLTF